MKDADKTLARRLALWLLDNAWLIVVVLAAFAVRLHWNLVEHPPADYIYSDMRGYARRADAMFESLWGVREYDAFYPFGTHVMLWFLQWVGGRANDSTPEEIQAAYRFAAGVYAVYGAALAGYGYALARRVSKASHIVAPLVGITLVCYYPLISLGGYFLSEVPFSLCLTAASLHLVRMLQEGKARDAWIMGIWVALGVTLRPQILLSVAFIGLYWVIFRKRMPKATVAMWGRALLPIVLLLGFTSWRVHYHTGRYGLISENGKFNQVFGRCHNSKITAHPDTRDRRRTSFGPPPLIQLANRAKRAPGEWPQLDPARETHFEYKGYIGDDEILQEYIDDCVKRTGWKKQVEYSLVNVVMQWRYNIMWPDSGKRPWQPYAQKWGWFVTNILAIPSLLGLLGLFFPRRHQALGLMSLHLWALTMIGIFYIGGMRFRAPYDPIIILLAAEVYVLPLLLAFRWLRSRLGETKASATGSES